MYAPTATLPVAGVRPRLFHLHVLQLRQEVGNQALWTLPPGALAVNRRLLQVSTLLEIINPTVNPTAWSIFPLQARTFAAIFWVQMHDNLEISLHYAE